MLEHLSEAAQRELLSDLNDCNLQEVRAFCREHSVPFAIYVELPSGGRRRTKDSDRKSIVLDRIRAYLTTGTVPPATCFPASVVATAERPAKLTARHRLFYGWYDKHDEALLALLGQLTDGRYKNGAVARILMREFWTAGVAPTFAEFASAWLDAEAKGLGIADGDHPEAAWLTDRARGEAGPDWRAKRSRIAADVISSLAELKRPKPGDLG